jgi:hypothetical protein
MSIDVPRLIAQLAEAGLDLVHAFDAHAVGELAIEEAKLEEADVRTPIEPAIATNRDGSTRMVLARTPRPLAKWTCLATGPRLGLLVGNTRALWPHFVAARPRLPATDPLDAYVERTLARVVGMSLERANEQASDARANDVERDARANDVERDARAFERHTPAADAVERLTRGDDLDTRRDEPVVLFSNRRYDASYLPFQQLAFTTGFAAPSDPGLAVHPIYGPWFALRAVIAINAPRPSELAKHASRPVDQPIERAIHALAMPAPRPIAKPCVCNGTCEKALEVARADVRDWRAWLAVRDACSLREHRYSDEQIRFHYASAWPKAARDG